MKIKTNKQWKSIISNSILLLNKISIPFLKWNKRNRTYLLISCIINIKKSLIIFCFTNFKNFFF